MLFFIPLPVCYVMVKEQAEVATEDAKPSWILSEAVQWCTVMRAVNAPSFLATAIDLYVDNNGDASSYSLSVITYRLYSCQVDEATSCTELKQWSELYTNINLLW